MNIVGSDINIYLLISFENNSVTNISDINVIKQTGEWLEMCVFHKG